MKRQSFAQMSKINYLGYILLHPWDGFQELKYNKKASPAIATVILALWYFFEIISRQSTDFAFNQFRPETLDIFKVALSTLLIFFVAVLSNWCFSTFMDGNGSLAEIYTVGAYALTPMVVSVILNVILSKFFVLEEAAMLNGVQIVAGIWSIVLILAALQETHELNFGQTVAMVLLTLVGMLAILFLVMLVYSLFQQVVMFVVNISYEIMYRFTM